MISSKQNKGPFLFFKNIRSQKNRNGHYLRPYLNSQALIIVLIVMVITFVLTAAFLAFSRTSYRINQAGLDSTRAYYLAYSGIEIARSQLEAGFDSYQGGELNCSGGTITITVAAKDEYGHRRVTSLGRFNNLYQRITRTYKLQEGDKEVCWVGCYGNSTVVKLNLTDGSAVTVTGYYPRSVSFNPTDGSCWVADYENSRVVKLKSDGTQAFPPVTGFSHPSSVSVNSSDGSCWVADKGNKTVVKLKSDGTQAFPPVTGFGWPSSVSVNPTDGSCWVADYGNNRIVKLKSDGTQAFDPVTGYYSLSVSVNSSDGSCWVADFYNDRVVKLNSDGQEIFSSRQFRRPLAVSAGTEPVNIISEVGE